MDFHAADSLGIDTAVAIVRNAAAVQNNLVLVIAAGNSHGGVGPDFAAVHGEDGAAVSRGKLRAGIIAQIDRSRTVQVPRDAAAVHGEASAVIHIDRRTKPEVCGKFAGVVGKALGDRAALQGQSAQYIEGAAEAIDPVSVVFQNFAVAAGDGAAFVGGAVLHGEVGTGLDRENTVRTGSVNGLAVQVQGRLQVFRNRDRLRGILQEGDQAAGRLVSGGNGIHSRLDARINRAIDLGNRIHPVPGIGIVFRSSVIFGQHGLALCQKEVERLRDLLRRELVQPGIGRADARGGGHVPGRHDGITRATVPLNRGLGRCVITAAEEEVLALIGRAVPGDGSAGDGDLPAVFMAVHAAAVGHRGISADLAAADLKGLAVADVDSSAAVQPS